MADLKISDPHLGTLTLLALERARMIKGHSGQILEREVQKCAAQVQAYIQGLHGLADEVKVAHREHG